MVAKQDLSLKGKYMGLCNRSHCLAPGANWLNPNNYNTYYCRACARMIQNANRGMEFWKPLTWNRYEKLTADQFCLEIEQFGWSITRAAQFGRWIVQQGPNWPHALPEHPLTREEWERLYLKEIL